MHVSEIVLAAAGAAAMACAPEYRPQPHLPVSITSGPASSGSAETAAPLDDASIATVVATLSNGQAERARLAQRQGHDPGVRRFAARVLADAPGESVALMNLAPRSSILDDELAEAAHKELDDLALRTGLGFDRAYVDGERKSLGDSIELLENTILPAAINEQLRASLVQMRATLADELRQASYLAATLPPASGRLSR